MERLTLDITGSPKMEMEAGCAKMAKLTLDIAGSIRIVRAAISLKKAR